MESPTMRTITQVKVQAKTQGKKPTVVPSGVSADLTADPGILIETGGFLRKPRRRSELAERIANIVRE